MTKRIKILFDLADPFIGADNKYHYFYRIRNIMNAKEYYGIHSTSNLSDGYAGSGKALARAKQKYGINAFCIQPLKFFNTKEESAEYEHTVVDSQYLLQNKGRTYNLIGGGNNSRFIPDDVKQKISMSEKGKTVSDETRKKLSQSKKGSTPWNKGLAGKDNPTRGSKRSKQTCQRISDGLHSYYANHDGVFLGKKHKEESKKKISMSRMGIKFSQDHRQKLSAAKLGTHHTDIAKKKISDTLRTKSTTIGFCKRVPIHCNELNLDFPSKKAAYRYLKDKNLIQCQYQAFSDSIMEHRQIAACPFTFKEINK